MKSLRFALINFGPVLAALSWFLVPLARLGDYVSLALLLAALFLALTSRPIGMGLSPLHRAKYIFFISAAITFFGAFNLGLMFSGVSMAHADGGLKGPTLFLSAALLGLIPFGLFLIIYVAPWFLTSTRLTKRFDPEFDFVLREHKSFFLTRPTQK
jgi:hypothetical protein